MTEVLTGQQLRDIAEACLDERRPDRERLRSVIGRAAHRIDELIDKVENLRQEQEHTRSEAALMMLEDAREAADKTLARVHEMEREAGAALDHARTAADAEVVTIIDEARAEADEIVAAARRKAMQIDQGCRRLVERAEFLDASYRERVDEIRAELSRTLQLMDRFDELPIADDRDELDTDAVRELIGDMVGLENDAEPDAGLGAEPDAGLGAEPDAGPGAGPDAGPDAGLGAGPGAGPGDGLGAEQTDELVEVDESATTG